MLEETIFPHDAEPSEMKKKKAAKPNVLQPRMSGSPARTRTTDPMVNSHLLYRLSYWGKSVLGGT
jgi:hypothetical protein